MIATVSSDPWLLQLDLRDPEKDDLSNIEFLDRLEKAWAVCDRFDLQTEIWRGRILRVVRDREKRGGEGRGWRRKEEDGPDEETAMGTERTRVCLV